MLTNIEYLEKVKREDIRNEVYKNKSEHQIEYRKMRALEIIAEELCEITERNKKIDKVMEGEE